MARFLFVVPPLTGHVNPTVAVGAELRDRGHEVAWAAHPRKVGPLLPEGARLLPLDDRLEEGLYERMTDQANRVRGLAALKFLWEAFLIPLARAMRPQVEAHVEAFAPDVLVVDQQAIAGALVARRRGLPWATSCTTSAGVTDPLAGLPRIQAWLQDSLARLQREAGLEVVEAPDLSPHLVLVFSTPALVGPKRRFPDHYAFVGPALGARPGGAFPEHLLTDPRPKILLTLGTVNRKRGERFYRTVAQAFEGAPWLGILVAPAEQAPDLPENVHRFDWVPQLAILPHLDAVVCHGGHNTVCEALAHGLPLVVAPVKDDQPVVAAQVEATGAGLRLKFGRLRPETLREAVARVLQEPTFAAAARRIAHSFASAGGANAAADRLEALA
ncbi:MAG: glycosyltransferase [Deltaproteobacteria bacterium]|nr:MAG: glycosyltransferase [Deltaproteobacteria bacterium]